MGAGTMTDDKIRTAKPRPKKPTPAQAKALRNMLAGKPAFIHISGRSASGGASGTLVSMFRRGWIEWNSDRTAKLVTAAGKAAAETS